MQKHKKMIKKSVFKLRSVVLFAVAFTVLGSSIAVYADQYDAQIQELSNQNSQTRNVVGGLQTQASTFQGEISRLQAQIDGIQASLNSNQAQQASLHTQIEEAKAKIVQQKAYLAEDIKAMYVDGGLSTIEQLASSENLSDYIDKEEYRTSVQNKVDTIIKEIAALQVKIEEQKRAVDILISQEQKERDTLASARSQQQSMLNYNESQQNAYNSQISSNNTKIAELRRAQIAANSRFSGGAPGTGYACGGGYPARWCERAQDSVLDSWGMYNRECVSYTAFRVSASGRFMPSWGFSGNADAKNWIVRAGQDGIPYDSNPQPGDVAISTRGTWGHAMYVDSVNSNGTINISQYNANYDGLYSTRSNVSPGGLYFIHF